MPKIAWTPCDDGFECAQVPVPLDYDAPRGATISLALIRLPATDRAHRIRPFELAARMRKGSFAEVLLAYDDEQAKKEAARCLRCDLAID